MTEKRIHNEDHRKRVAFFAATLTYDFGLEGAIAVVENWCQADGIGDSPTAELYLDILTLLDRRLNTVQGHAYDPAAGSPEITRPG